MSFNHVVVNDYSNIDTGASNVGVFVRFRPLEYATKIEEKTLIASFLHMEEGNSKLLEIRNPNSDGLKSQGHSEVIFAFDQVFDTEATQEDIFAVYAKPQVDRVIEGFNACCFAYGQTGSGKTFSMFGDAGAQTFDGVIPRTVSYIFEKLKDTPNEVAVGCSFLEIYNERIRDLAKNYDISKMDPSQRFMPTSALYDEVQRKVKDAMMDHQSEQFKDFQQQYESMNCEIQQDENGRVYVKNLTTLSVTSPSEVMDMITFGLALRATHATKMNATSSRSHTIFTLYVAQKLIGTNDTILGQLHLVDLAGSERQKSAESVGNRFVEANNINTSLSALGKVIVALDPNSGVSHVPYRESKLTRVLQNSLSRNSFVSVLAHIHPRPQWYEESLSTLEFANRLRNVHNNPHVNHFSSIDVATKWTYRPKVFGNVVIEPEIRPPLVRLMYSHEPKLYWKLNAYATFEVYEHVNDNIIEVVAFDADSEVEFNHIYLAKNELFAIYKREVTIYEKRKSGQQAMRKERHHEHGSISKHHTNEADRANHEESSEEMWLAKDIATRDKWIGDYIMARINPVSKTETTPPSIGVVALEHDIRLEDGTLPFIANKPTTVLPVARSAPGPGEKAKAIDGKFEELHNDHSMVQNHLTRANQYQAAAFHHSQAFITANATLALDMSRLNVVPEGELDRGIALDTPDGVSGGYPPTPSSDGHLPAVDSHDSHSVADSGNSSGRARGTHSHRETPRDGMASLRHVHSSAASIVTKTTSHLPSVAHTPASSKASHSHLFHGQEMSDDNVHLPVPPLSLGRPTSSKSSDDRLPSSLGHGHESVKADQRIQSKHSQSFNDIEPSVVEQSCPAEEPHKHHHHHHHKKHHHHHHQGHDHSTGIDDVPNTI